MLNLDTVIYKKIEDGDYILTPKIWELRTITGDKPQEFIALQCQLGDTDRLIQVSLFEQGLNIFASNIINHFNLEEMALKNILDYVIGKPLPAQHETKLSEDGSKTYYNWYICRKERLVPETDSDSEDTF